jgi:transcriptional regulator of acetoin/glycerol metabolism/AraC-like DNA-binding protein
MIVRSAAFRESTGRDFQHVEHVHLVMDGGAPASAIEEVSTSWERSARKYGVDPADSQAPRIFSHSEVKGLREPLEDLIRSGRDQMGRLHNIVRRAGYVVLLCDANGVAIDHRAEEGQADEFRYWGTWLGGVWSEEAEGTNGIGTCIIEERPVTVHRSQHFRSRHIGLSCSGAPIFGIDGKLMAVLDVSAIDPGLSEHAHALTGSVTAMFASMIEERFFREYLRRDWIIALAPLGDDDGAALLAVDGDQRIVGANRVARAMLSLDDTKLREGISLWRIFERNADLLRSNQGVAFRGQLVTADGNVAVSALVTPPGSPSAALTSLANTSAQVGPRPALVAATKGSSPAPVAYGGLPPGALRRVREYIDVHLGDRTQLTELAAVAGVSVHHFAREFKRSTGVAPHDYLVQKRVDRAREMLARTGWSLSEVAFAAGFSDQSHMARHFRRLVGMTPGQFRWSQR